MKQLDNITVTIIRKHLVAIKNELEKGNNELGSNVSSEYINEKLIDIQREVLR